MSFQILSSWLLRGHLNMCLLIQNIFPIALLTNLCSLTWKKYNILWDYFTNCCETSWSLFKIVFTCVLFTFCFTFPISPLVLLCTCLILSDHPLYFIVVLLAGAAHVCLVFGFWSWVLIMFNVSHQPQSKLAFCLCLGVTRIWVPTLQTVSCL